MSWIEVEKQKPDVNTPVFVFDGSETCVAKLDKEGDWEEQTQWAYACGERCGLERYIPKHAITHWRPIFEKPNKLSTHFLEQAPQHDIYLFKVRDYTTILLGRYDNGVFYVQRGDGEKYEYDEDRVVWKQKLDSDNSHV